MNKELKNDLVATWNEIEEVLTDFRDLTNEELIECREAIYNRLGNALYWLDKYVDEKDVLKELKKS